MGQSIREPAARVLGGLTALIVAAGALYLGNEAGGSLPLDSTDDWGVANVLLASAVAGGVLLGVALTVLLLARWTGAIVYREAALGAGWALVVPVVLWTLWIAGLGFFIDEWLQVVVPLIAASAMFFRISRVSHEHRRQD